MPRSPSPAVRTPSPRISDADYLAELERVALFADIQRGVLPESAGRPLLPHEVAAKVDFVEIDGIFDAAYAATAAILDGVRDLITAAFRELLAGQETLSPAQLTARVLQFTTAMPTALRAKVGQGTVDVAEVLAMTMGAAGVALIGEARRQGVAGAALTRAERDLDRRVEKAEEERVFFPAAGTATVAVWQRLGTVAAQVDGPLPSTAAAVLDVVDGTPIDAAYDLARQGAHIAGGSGRDLAATALPDPVTAYASELLDKNTCSTCSAVDGRQYATLDDARKDYPGLGPLARCDGGARCRGSVVISFMESKPSR